MSTRIQFHIVVLFCLYLTASFTLGGISDVLCVAEGDIKIESVCQPCCAESEQTCPPVTDDPDSDWHKPCHGCADIPLSSESLSGRSFRLPDTAATPDLVLTSVDVPGIAIPVDRTQSKHASRSNSPPAPFHLVTTTVLIC